MTVLTGDLESISGTKFGGPGCAVLIYSRITRIGFATDAMILELVDRIPMPTEKAGKFTSPVMDPGPIRVELEGREVHGQGWDIDLPESGTWSLAALIDAQVEWSPAVVSRAETAAQHAADAAADAGASAVRAEKAVTFVEAAVADGAKLIRSHVSEDADRAESARTGAETAQSNAEKAATETATGVRTELEGLVTQAGGHVTAAGDEAGKAAGSASAAASSAEAAAGDAELVKTAVETTTWEEDRLTVLGATSPSLTGPVGPPGVVISDTEPLNGEVWIDISSQASEDTTVGVVLVETVEQAQALPVGTLYIVTGVREATAPIAVTGHAAGQINDTSFIPVIPGASAGDRVVIGINTKAVAGMTITPPPGYTQLVGAWWTGTQTSWIFIGPYTPGSALVVSSSAEIAWVAVAASGVTGHAVGEVKDRSHAPVETNTVTALPVEASEGDIVLGFAFERTTANETAEQVTVSDGWEKLAYAAQGINIQTALVARGKAGSTMTATYPNPQGTNGAGVQVVLRG